MSIRLRVVLGTLVVTLVAVTSVGALAVSLIDRYTTARQRSDLESSARSLAVEALPLLADARSPVHAPGIARLRLLHLARAAAFMGSTQVRILDVDREVLVDSGPRDSLDHVVWFGPESEQSGPTGPVLLLELGSGDATLSALQSPRVSGAAELHPGMARGVVRRFDGAGGPRLTFERVMAGRLPGEAGASPTRAVPRRPDVAVTVAVGAEHDPIGYVELSASPDLTRAAVREAARAFGIAGILAALLATGVGLMVSRTLTAPLHKLTETAAQMGAGNLSTRADTAAAGEIGHLAQAFNSMAAGLESSFRALERERDALRRFAADASHQLRTPITALANFHALLMGPAAGDAAARTEFLADAQNQVERLDRITTSLLDLSRLEGGIAELDKEWLEPADLVARAIQPFLPRANAAGVTLLTSGPDATTPILADGARLEMAIGNLVDNAVSASTPGGRVLVTWRFEADGLVIEVADSGPGVPEADRHHIFERFYRGPATAWPGSGLGLAFAASVASAHGGRLELASDQPEGGAVFRLSLPG